MTRLAHDTYLDHLRSESRRFREVLADCDLDARVPTCPDWTAGDLLWHLGAQVQLFWAGVVERRPAGPEWWVEPERPDSPAGWFDVFDDAHARLCAGLASVDPAEPVWTWSSDRTAGFVGRRQAHEALIHRLDAELVTGTTTALDPALATDGVDEVLDVMFGGTPAWGSFTPGEGLLRFDLPETATSLWVRLGEFSGTDPDDGTTYRAEPDLEVVPDPGTGPDAVVAGPAGAVDAWLWHRGDDALVSVEGDRATYDRFAAIVNASID